MTERLPQRGSLLSPVAWIAVSLIAAGAITTFALFPLSGRSGLLQAMQSLVLGYSSLALCLQILYRHREIISLVFWIFVYSLFGLVQTVQLSEGDNPFHISIPDELAARQAFIILLGCAGADVGFRIARRRRAVAGTKTTSSRATLSLSRVRILGWFTLCVSPFLVASSGGLALLFASRSAVRGQLNDLSSQSAVVALLAAVSNALPFACLLGVIVLRLTSQFVFREHVDLIFLTAGLVAVNAILNNPISQPRYWLATVVVALFLSVGALRSRLGISSFAVILVALTLFVFPYLDFGRYGLGSSIFVAQPPTYFYLNKTDYGSATDITNVVSLVDSNGYAFGRQLLGALLFFVPRSVWPDKPMDTARLIGESINFSNLNLDSPLWAEGYVDFGYLGAFGYLLVFSLVTGTMQARALRDWDLKIVSRSAFLVPALAGYELILLRGSLLQATGRLSVLVLVATLLCSKARRYSGVTQKRLSRPLSIYVGGAQRSPERLSS